MIERASTGERTSLEAQALTEDEVLTQEWSLTKKVRLFLGVLTYMKPHRELLLLPF